MATYSDGWRAVSSGHPEQASQLYHHDERLSPEEMSRFTCAEIDRGACDPVGYLPQGSGSSW